jgi:hypothetical protein
MWRPPEEIQADLTSTEPERIAAGLRDMREAMESLVDEFEWSHLELELLTPFGGKVPAEVQHDLARIWAGYRSFQPPLERQDALYRMAELATIYGDHRVAWEASMALKISNDPPVMVTRVLARLRDRGLQNEREVLGAGGYLSYLLDGKPEVRAATISALKDWRDGLLAKAVDFIRPQLEDHELQQLAG